jgi:hypothetical protein
MALTKRKSLRKRRAKRTKKFRGGSWSEQSLNELNAFVKSGGPNAEQAQDMLDKNDLENISNNKSNPNKSNNPGDVERAFKENMKNIPDLPTGSILGIGLVVGLVGAGTYFLIASKA